MTYRILRPFLFVLSRLYGVIISARNYLYDKGLLTSTSFEIPIICVGNLTAGGSGKTPHVEYLIRLLSPHFQLVVLSRGYGRKTKGFVWADDASTPQTIGDEPFMYFKKFKIPVVVCENRVEGVKKILCIKPDTEVVVMDDGFQHRSIRPSLNIILTQYDKPFFKDSLLPLGRLRESAKAVNRADAVVVTKCPDTFQNTEKELFEKKIGKGMPLFFSRIRYLEPRNSSGEVLQEGSEISLVCGIAHPKTLQQYAQKKFQVFECNFFSDHHNYTDKEIAAFRQSPYKILTSEKDFVKLRDVGEFIYYQPIEVEISPDFEAMIFSHLQKKKSF